MFVIADLKAVQPFPFYQRMKGFDTGIIRDRFKFCVNSKN